MLGAGGLPLRMCVQDCQSLFHVGLCSMGPQLGGSSFGAFGGLLLCMLLMPGCHAHGMVRPP
jgi:hypothetical protein